MPLGLPLTFGENEPEVAASRIHYVSASALQWRQVDCEAAPAMPEVNRDSAFRITAGQRVNASLWLLHASLAHESSVESHERPRVVLRKRARDYSTLQRILGIPLPRSLACSGEH